MKSVIQRTYKGPDHLVFEDVPKPVLNSNQVLVKVEYAAVNDFDWSMVWGKPLLYRLMFGIWKPKKTTPGMEIAGIVSEVGQGCKNLKVGDRVYADISEDGFSGFAECVALNEETLVLTPKEFSSEKAVTIPHASLLAYQGLILSGRIKKGDDVLINGAGGGMGLFAIQIAKSYTSSITGVDKDFKFDMMKDLGCSRLIDFQKVDFTRESTQYDLVLDARTKRGLFSIARSLKKGGVYVTVGGDISRLLGIFFFGWIAKLLTGKSFKIAALKPNKYLPEFYREVSPENLRTYVDGPYAFEDLPMAIKRFGDANHIGKIVIKIQE